MSLELPSIDALLILAFLISFLIMAVFHLYHRPELNGYAELDRMHAYAYGIGTIIFSFIGLTLARALMSGVWHYPHLQAIADIIAVTAGAAGATWLLRKQKPLPAVGNPYEKLANVQRESEEVFRGATSD